MRKSFILFFIFFLFLQFLCHAQNTATPSHENKGNLYIGNWIPADGNDGPYINSISLEYVYGIDSLEPTQKFNIIWHLGNQVIIDGKKYSKEDIGEAAFGKITITDIDFRAKIYSGGKLIGTIIIDYPSIVPKSGRKSGWYITGSPEWNDIFINIPTEKAKEIFEEGFELREPQVHRIEFAGLDSLLLQTESKTGSPVVTKVPNVNSTSSSKSVTTPVSAKKKSKKKNRLKHLQNNYGWTLQPAIFTVTAGCPGMGKSIQAWDIINFLSMSSAPSKPSTGILHYLCTIQVLYANIVKYP